MTLAGKLRTLRALGVTSTLRVARYRAGLRSGWHPVRRLAEGPLPEEPFFAAQVQDLEPLPFDRRWMTELVRFDWMTQACGTPDWLSNPLGRHRGDVADRSWWSISDFGAGDIKGLWEASRFNWVVALAAAAAAGEPGASARLNGWLSDWCRATPAYRGPNWKCGQEASIRVMHLAAAALILGEDAAPMPALIDLVARHCARIAPTIGYALGQDNNHGTSEAAALFIGGSLLAGAGDPRGRRWSTTGRRWLEERAQRLIAPDGSFSQHSVTYHRLMLDTYALAECWRQRRGLPAFSASMRSRLGAATTWLRTLVDDNTGDAPNIGASDGARLLPLTDCGYRDFRPSVQLASALFLGQRAFEAGSWDAPARWMGVALPVEAAPAPTSRSFDDGGWHVLRFGDALAVMRYPRFRFRPGQADALHVDLTAHGENLLRDAGTYSYNDASVPDGDFAGTAFHNTVTFDGADQMPRLSRFLFGDWLVAKDVELVTERDGGVEAAAGYRDRRGNRHHRRVRLESSRLVCTDAVSGQFGEATLRWRLPPGPWRLEGNKLTGAGGTLAIEATGAEPVLALAQGREARCYAQIGAVVQLEVTVTAPCTIVTHVDF